jgi:hypothetical protein
VHAQPLPERGDVRGLGHRLALFLSARVGGCEVHRTRQRLLCPAEAVSKRRRLRAAGQRLLLRVPGRRLRPQLRAGAEPVHWSGFILQKKLKLILKLIKKTFIFKFAWLFRKKIIKNMMRLKNMLI